MKISGIYKIQSIRKPQRCYIGSAKNLHVRWGIHLSELRRNKHHSVKLQNHYNKYGETDLQFSLLLGCDIEDLIKIEQYFIDTYKPFFNIQPNAGSNLGWRHSEETKEKIRRSLFGQRHSEERKLNNSLGHKGIKHSEEINRKSGEARKGHIVTDETRQKIRKTLVGQKHTDERRANISKSLKGMKAWNKGLKMSEESRKKLSESKKGKEAWNKGRKFIKGKYVCLN